MKTLEFKTTIHAPVPQVWEIMLNSDTYRQWTSPFTEGSYFVGTWEEGTRMYFLNPENAGMVAEVAQNRRHEFISLKILGFVADGIEDFESEEVKAWAPAFENYEFSPSPSDPTGDSTELRVTVEVAQEHEAMMTEPWLQALEVLKALCEAR